MAFNPLVPLGTLNRALTSISVIDFPELNVTTGFFADKVARITFDNDSADYIPALAGSVPSPRIYQVVTVMAYINKSQGLAAAWEQQRLTNTVIGDVNVVTDAVTLDAYYLQNCILQNISDLDLGGTSTDYPLMIKGTYAINNQIFT